MDSQIGAKNTKDGKITWMAIRWPYLLPLLGAYLEHVSGAREKVVAVLVEGYRHHPGGRRTRLVNTAFYRLWREIKAKPPGRYLFNTQNTQPCLFAFI
jgi:hypothetical protein